MYKVISIFLMNAFPGLFQVVIYLKFGEDIVRYFIYFTALNIFFAVIGNFMAYSYVSYKIKANGEKDFAQIFCVSQLFFSIIVFVIFACLVVYFNNLIFLVGMFDLFVMLQISYIAKVYRLTDDYFNFIVTTLLYSLPKVLIPLVILLFNLPENYVFGCLLINSISALLFFLYVMPKNVFSWKLMIDCFHFNKFLVLAGIFLGIIIAGDRFVLLFFGLDQMVLNIGYVSILGQLIFLLASSYFQKLEAVVLERAGDLSFILGIFNNFFFRSIIGAVVFAIVANPVFYYYFYAYEAPSWFLYFYLVNIIIIASLNYWYSVLLGLGKTFLLASFSMGNALAVLVAMVTSMSFNMNYGYIIASLLVNITSLTLMRIYFRRREEMLW